MAIDTTLCMRHAKRIHYGIEFSYAWFITIVWLGTAFVEVYGFHDPCRLNYAEFNLAVQTGIQLDVWRAPTDSFIGLGSGAVHYQTLPE